VGYQAIGRENILCVEKVDESMRNEGKKKKRGGANELRNKKLNGTYNEILTSREE